LRKGGREGGKKERGMKKKESRRVKEYSGF